MPETLPNEFHLPHRLRRLADLAYNLWWTWQPEAPLVFEQIDPSLWEQTYHNPVRFLRQVDPERIQRVTQDRSFLDFYDDLTGRFDDYMQAASTWTDQTLDGVSGELTAYLSTEFGLHETLPIYAGGLGILSGDHLKEASDLGLPMVAVGFLYTQGYFSQRITEDGWQEADYLNLSFPDLPVLPVTKDDGQRLTIGVGIQERQIQAQLWRIQVGRVPLYLLDTNIASNAASDRNLTARLYTSDLELRLAQEVVLGIGGVRALRALGLEPATWHMNEGHSAF
ncbi:MAG TPA: alpha-glucan family phosphorylase, partial [Anaerolineales bacterium]